MRVPTDTILKACPIILILDKLNNQYTSSLWYFNVHPKLQLQTHPIVKSKSWTLPRQHLCSADDDAVRPCCWSFSTTSFFSGKLSDIYMYNVISLLSHLLVAGCDIGVRFSVRPSVSPSIRLSTFMSTFDIYVKVSILINYKTKQPSNLA